MHTAEWYTKCTCDGYVVHTPQCARSRPMMLLSDGRLLPVVSASYPNSPFAPINIKQEPESEAESPVKTRIPFPPFKRVKQEPQDSEVEMSISNAPPYVPGQHRTYSYHAPPSSVSGLQLQTSSANYATTSAASSQLRPQTSPYSQRPILPPLPTPSLHCDEERIDGRKSPELWPEPVPGALEIERQSTVLVPTQKQTQRFNTQLDPDDVRLVNDLGRLSANQLFEYVSTLQNNALILGIDEKRQFERGRLLQIFPKPKNGIVK